MDNKYGRIFTASDVEKILEFAGDENSISLDEILPKMEEAGVRFKFPADEPLFTFRGRDKRAIGAIRHYQDHQSPNAPVNHEAAIEAAMKSFIAYREDHPELMKEPD